MCSSSLYFHPPYAKPLDCISVQSNWLFVFTSTFQNSSHIHFPQRPRFCGIQYRSSSLKSSSHASCVCRRHSDLRSLSFVWRWPSYTAGVCLHSRGFAVDEGKPAAAESSQDRVSWCASYVNTMISTDPSCRWCFGIASHYRPVSWCPVHINADITMTLLMRSNFILTSRRTTIQFCTSIASDRQKRTAKARWGSGVYLQHPAFCQANQEQSRPQDVRVATGRRPSRQHYCQSRKHLPTTRAV